jgi:hypothetical protein
VHTASRLVQVVARPRRLVLPLLLGSIAPTPAGAQAALSAAPPARPTFSHHREIASEYDAARDTTTVSLVLSRGKYFLWIQHPRVTVGYRYPGRTRPVGGTVEGMLIEFRTQEPQAAGTNRLTITGAARPSANTDASEGEVRSVLAETEAIGSNLEPHAFTHDHRLTFLLPAEDAARVLRSQHVVLDAGGVKVRLKQEQLEAWRELGWGMGIVER